MHHHKLQSLSGNPISLHIPKLVTTLSVRSVYPQFWDQPWGFIGCPFSASLFLFFSFSFFLPS
ncbi:hypothetical protein BDV29DRAFT_170936, partial [Aspergillus leporis]